MPALILKPDHLGDFVLTLPALWEARQFLGQEEKVDMGVAPMNLGWQEILPWLGNLFPLEHPRYSRKAMSRKERLKESWRLLKEARGWRERGYQTGIELGSTANDRLSKALLWVAGIKQRYGAKGSMSFLLNKARAIHAEHETERLAQRFPKDWNVTGKTRPAVFMPKELRWEHTSHEDVVLLSPWVGTSAKAWPKAHWEALMAELNNFCVLTPPAHMEEALAWKPVGKERILPTRSIRETLENLCRVRLVVGVDSAVAHFCWLTGTPLVEIFSGTTDPRRWMSLARGICLKAEPECAPCHLEACTRSKHECMEDVSVQRVIEAVGQVAP